MTSVSPPRQAPLPGLSPVPEAVALMAAGGHAQRGAIYTRREVVEFILDLSGYTSDRPLYNYCLLEPCFGDGDFLQIVIERLIKSWKRADPHSKQLSPLEPCIRGVELHQPSFRSTRNKIIAWLQEERIAAREVEQLVDTWFVQDDFLLTELSGSFDFVVGNPPYVRQELIPAPLIAEYRSRYRTVFDRADIYIPFIERSLTLLSDGGHLGFICADRWMKNRYGGPLRQMVAESYQLKAYVDMTDTPAFHSDVIAYPAITIISKEKPGKTRIAYRPNIDKTELNSLAQQIRDETPHRPALPSLRWPMLPLDRSHGFWHLQIT